MDDLYVYPIAALLPLSALILVFQRNPYHALVIRGILGAVAALVYAIFGAADVALTEALVGTMLAIALYAVAVRSSLVMRLGILKDKEDEPLNQLIADLRTTLDKYQVRIELVHYPDMASLDRALIDKEIHATCLESTEEAKPYHTTTRIDRLYEIMQTELSSAITSLSMHS